MSDDSRNPFSELTRELERRGKEIASQDAPVGSVIKDLIDLFAEGDRRFAEMLANRQGTAPVDFQLFYRLKAELDRRLLKP